MEENTNAVQAESAPATQDEIIETQQPVSVATEAQPPEDMTEAETVSEKESPEGKKPGAAEKRIRQLLSKQKQALEEAQYWKSRAQEVAPEAKELPLEPHIDDFDTYEDFLVAKTRHEIMETQKRETTHKEQERVEREFMGRIDKAAQSNPEIYSVLNDASLPINAAMGLVIKNSENAAELLMYLGEHREEAFSIARLDPLSAVKEMGKLELKISNANKPQPVRKVSLAPEPIKPLEATGSPTVDLEKVSMDEYMRTRNKGMVTGRLKRIRNG